MSENLNRSREWARWRWVVAQVAAAWPVLWITTQRDRVCAIALRTAQHPPALNDNSETA